MSSELKTNKISPATGTALQIGDSGDTITIPSGATLTNSGSATGFGKVLQVVSASYNGNDSTTSNSFVNTGLTQAITPSATSSKVLIICSITAGGAGDARPGFCIKRGSTELNLGSATDPSATSARTLVTSAEYVHYADSIVNAGITYLDSPSTTSATTYALAMLARDASFASILNISSTEGDYQYVYRGVSTIVLMEIAG
tara:strand:- start:275 stop:877 length:603 start_codon:yes stop_codon:yes gene_type:complete